MWFINQSWLYHENILDTLKILLVKSRKSATMNLQSRLSHSHATNDKGNHFLDALQSSLELLSINTQNFFIITLDVQAWTDRWDHPATYFKWSQSETWLQSKRPDLRCATWQHTDNRDAATKSLSAFLSFLKLRQQGPPFFLNSLTS